MNNFDTISFEELNVLETLAETHEGNTKIYLAKVESNLIVCKAISKIYLMKDTKSIEHAKNEKQALIHFTQIKHQNICSLLGKGQDSQCLYFYLEAVMGLPLHKLIQMTGPLNNSLVKLIGCQVCWIMKDFHNAGFVYRDIKASNFIIDEKGKVKMIDLGHSKKINSSRTFTVCGTAHAIPPDVYAKQGYSYEFDYYSFGILLYELLVGKSPFGYGTLTEEMIEKVKKGLTEEILSQIKDEEAKQLIEALVVSDPEKRLGKKGGFNEILEHPYLGQNLEEVEKIFKGEQKMCKYDQRFSLYVSEIEDFGVDAGKYEEVSEEDPFFKFL